MKDWETYRMKDGWWVNVYGAVSTGLKAPAEQRVVVSMLGPFAGPRAAREAAQAAYNRRLEYGR